MKSVTLTIDGKSANAAPGETILNVADRLGIDIPTLCHLRGMALTETCGVCMVEIDGRRDLAPACATRVADGMVVRTDNEHLRRVRRVALELLLSDHVGDCTAPCELTCPAGIGIPAFIAELEAGRPIEALAVMKQSVAFPGVLGRICPRPCERVCRRGEVDEPISIMHLKRVCADADREAASPYVPQMAPPTGKCVAVVGAGIAGLTAAFFLRRLGHHCTVFDADSEPGGVMRIIPGFRMPADALAAEIDVLRRVGVEFQTARLGEDLELDALASRFDAVLIAIGNGREERPDLPGAEWAEASLNVLRSAGEPASAVVFGAGPAGLDVCRTLLRLGAPKVRLLVERGTPGLLLRDQVGPAEAEGVLIQTNAKVLRVEESGEHYRVVTRSGDAEEVIQADRVIYAGETKPDLNLLARLGLDVTEPGLTLDPGTLATSRAGVFAAGSVTRATMAVQAGASGRRAAESISAFLSAETFEPPDPVNVRMHPLSDEQRNVLLADVGKQSRENLDETGEGPPVETARRETGRCLHCECAAQHTCALRDLASRFGADPKAFAGETPPFQRETSHPDIVYEPAKCIKCGRCVRVTEEAREPLGLTFIGRGFSVRVGPAFSEEMKEGLREVALRCVDVCPTGALYRRRCRG